MEFNQIWESIINYSGETFYTKRGLPFTYTYSENKDGIKPYRNGKWVGRVLTKQNFIKALTFGEMSGPDFSNSIIGPSYVRALLTDKRIVN